jgi:acyl-CoA-binding protein
MPRGGAAGGNSGDKSGFSEFVDRMMKYFWENRNTETGKNVRSTYNSFSQNSKGK